MSKTNLNEQQQQVVDSNSSRILCLAGAGAGKTATMIQRISRLVKEGVSPSNILVLTFTNAAGFEMKERYKNANPKQMIPEFRTFHSFCYSLIVRDARVRLKIGYRDVPKVVEDTELKRLYTQTKMQLGITLSEGKLKGKVGLNKTEKEQVDLYYKALNKAIKDENIITFDRLSTLISNLFVKNDDTVLKYKSQYQYIFVDEFQDTDPEQIKFLNSFESAHFCFVGDCLQNIYKFRGCTNDIIKLLSKDNSWEKIKLYQNYRSTNQICKFANNMSTYADDEYRIEMNGQRDGDKVEVISGSCSSFKHVVDSDCVDMLIERLRESKGDVAILCRTNREVDYMQNVLSMNEIECYSGKADLESKHILKSVQTNEYMLDWLATFLNAQKYGEYIRLAAQQENPDIRWFLKEYGNLPQICDRAKQIIAIRNTLSDKNKPSISKCVDVLTTLGLFKDSMILENLPESNRDIIDYILDMIDKSSESQIYVGTIHSSKGLEYDNVFILNVDDTPFRLSKGEEELNLYYVAITRAKNKLTIFKR